MEILGKIFGSEAKVKMMRLFLFNSGRIYDLEEVERRTNVNKDEARRELINLENIGLVSKRKFSKNVSKILKIKKKKGRRVKIMTKTIVVKRKLVGWSLNYRFTYLKELQSLLINTILLKGEEILRRFQGIGKIKLIIVAGVFIQNPDSRVDIFIVGDKINKKKVTAIVRRMEAEIGKELQYTSFDTQDFKYRMSIFDRLVRDVLDYPHEVLLDKIGIKLSF